MVNLTEKWVKIEVSDLANYPDGINQIYRGEIDGIHIKQVFTQAEMFLVKQNLDRKKEELSQLCSQQRYGDLIGAVLTANGSDTTSYFQDAARLRNELTAIFNPDYESTITAIFRELSGGRQVEVAHKNGNAYSPAQIRFTYPDRGGIGLHKGNEFINLPGFEQLHEIVKLKNCLSYYLVIDKPEQGGELILYDDLPEELTIPKQKLDLENCQQRRYDPEVGDLIIFHGACIWHAVSEVKGSKIRYSIGGFVGLSQDEEKIHYWA
ncbi:MAG: 2OG-Fe(II) oxygenase [Oscillatoria sp. PMC 1051.18]|nr:2OG-Fe(II) oxygenase [Oscillatoria sp. PMC 1050.18]MEC5033189.1 2OG-Fe(II) oxygenase [Oscillatoria sp. PMC 1051.18]